MKIARIINCSRASLPGRLLGDQYGQVLPWAAFMLISMLGMGALSIDFGRAYLAYSQLKASASAAALAGAEQLPNANATSVATQYSSAATSDYNSYAWMSSVTVTVTGECYSSLSSAGMSCVAPGNANAIQVTESYNVPTFFARLFGITQIPVAAQATASMRGAASIPYNVAIIVDTTHSMNDTDSDSQCSTSRIACALSGVQTLLENMAPCKSSLSSCGTVTTNSSDGSGNVPNPVDVVALFQFPNMTEATVANDYGCGTSATHASDYQYPTHTDTTYTRASDPPGTLINPSSDGAYNSTYEVVGFSSDYKTQDNTSTLNPSSNLVKAVGGKSGCAAMTAPGGLGTYYAGVIYAAQAALTAEQTARTNAGVNSQNVIVLISDGDATSSQTDMGGTASGASSGGSYPSWNNECAQAETAASYAAGKGTHVYAVAYGAESSGCTTDSPSITPCQTMQGIASSSQYFYSDYTATGGSSGCVAASQPTTNLNQIFTDIANDFTAARLIPNGG